MSSHHYLCPRMSRIAIRQVVAAVVSHAYNSSVVTDGSSVVSGMFGVWSHLPARVRW